MANRKERRERRGKAQFSLEGDAVAETPRGMAFRIGASQVTGDKHVVVFVVPGVPLDDAAAELRLLADALERVID